MFRLWHLIDRRVGADLGRCRPSRETRRRGEVRHAPVGNFRSEACGVADFNSDGKLDIVAGPYLYLAPDCKPRQDPRVRGSVDEQGKGYYHDFMNVPLDVDGDGRLDVVSCSWFDRELDLVPQPG